MVYQADVISSNVAEAVEVLSDAVLNPKFNPWEVNEQVKRLQADLKVIAGNPQTMLMEVGFLKIPPPELMSRSSGHRWTSRSI